MIRGQRVPARFYLISMAICRQRLQRECENFYPQPSWVEQNANTIWSSTVGVISEAVAAANLKMEDVAAIGITNQRETTIIWDKLTGQPIYMAIVWQSRQK